MPLVRITLRDKEMAYLRAEHSLVPGLMNRVGVEIVLWALVLCWPHRREWAVFRTAAGRREVSRKRECRGKTWTQRMKQELPAARSVVLYLLSAVTLSHTQCLMLW